MAGDVIDVIIPTCKDLDAVKLQLQEIADTAGCEVIVFATCRQLSAAKNRNLGLEWARSEYRIMLDDDISGLPQNWLIDLIEVLKDHPECVMVSPALLNPDGSPATYMMGRECDNAIRSGLEIVKGPHLLTACIALRKDDLRFDESFQGSGYEDNAYCDDQNARYPGCVRIINHDVAVIHANEMKRQREFWSENKARYEERCVE